MSGVSAKLISSPIHLNASCWPYVAMQSLKSVLCLALYVTLQCWPRGRANHLRGLCLGRGTLAQIPSICHQAQPLTSHTDTHTHTHTHKQTHQQPSLSHSLSLSPLLSLPPLQVKIIMAAVTAFNNKCSTPHAHPPAVLCLCKLCFFSAVHCSSMLTLAE